MSKKFRTGLLSATFFLTLLVVLSYCSSDSELTPSSKIEFKDQIKVTNQNLEKFKSGYELFINSLNASQQALILNYLEMEEVQESARVAVEATCHCSPGQSTCSASTAVSSCCVCWNPSTQTGGCGTYFGIASCKVEQSTPPPGGGGNAPQATVEPEIRYVTFYPKNFKAMLKMLSENSVSTKTIETELNTLVLSAE